jgi:hypothetical protein
MEERKKRMKRIRWCLYEYKGLVGLIYFNEGLKKGLEENFKATR